MKIQKVDGNENEKNEITKRQIIILIILLLVLVFVIYQAYILTLYTFGKKEKKQLKLYNYCDSIISKVMGKEIILKEEYSLKFAGIGDISASEKLGNFKVLQNYNNILGLTQVIDKLNTYDIITASVSGSILKENYDFEGIMKLLKNSNISTVALANYNIFNKNESGLIKTIENLDENGINQIGANSTNTRKDPIIISKNQISIGFLSYTTKTNQKLNKNNTNMVNIFSDENLKYDLEYLNSKNVDFIVAYLNVPTNNSNVITYEQKNIVEKLFLSGVDVVLGTGNTNVQEQIEEVEIDKPVYAIYSLGNFYGNFEDNEENFSVIANIEFKKNVTKDQDGNLKQVEKDMIMNEPITVLKDINKNKIEYIMLSEEIKRYDEGNSNITLEYYNKIKNMENRLKNIIDP